MAVVGALSSQLNDKHLHSIKENILIYSLQNKKLVTPLCIWLIPDEFLWETFLHPAIKCYLELHIR